MRKYIAMLTPLTAYLGGAVNDVRFEAERRVA